MNGRTNSTKVYVMFVDFFNFFFFCSDLLNKFWVAHSKLNFPQQGINISTILLIWVRMCWKEKSSSDNFLPNLNLIQYERVLVWSWCPKSWQLVKITVHSCVVRICFESNFKEMQTKPSSLLPIPHLASLIHIFCNCYVWLQLLTG